MRMILNKMNKYSVYCGRKQLRNAFRVIGLYRAHSTQLDAFEDVNYQYSNKYQYGNNKMRKNQQQLVSVQNHLLSNESYEIPNTYISSYLIMKDDDNLHNLIDTIINSNSKYKSKLLNLSFGIRVLNQKSHENKIQQMIDMCFDIISDWNVKERIEGIRIIALKHL